MGIRFNNAAIYNAWPNNYGAYVARVDITFRVGSAVIYQSSITTPKADFGTMSNMLLGPPTASRSVDVQLLIIDSRGFRFMLFNGLAYLPYERPSISMTQSSIWRSALAVDNTTDPPTITDDEYESEDGRFMSLNVSATCTDLRPATNFLRVKVATKRHSEPDTGNIDT